MYKPKFNHVLVEIDTTDEVWGKRDQDNLGGVVYREGTVVEVANEIFPTSDQPDMSAFQWTSILAAVNGLVGKKVMWNEGHEAGTVFEHKGKKYALIYWFDIIGVKDGE